MAAFRTGTAILVASSCFGPSDDARREAAVAVCDQILDSVPSSKSATILPSIRNPQEALRTIEEAYPSELRRKGVGGEVSLSMLIDSTGMVAASRVVRSSGDEDLDSAAVMAARDFRFSPAYAVDRPTCHRMTLPVRFSP